MKNGIINGAWDLFGIFWSTFSCNYRRMHFISEQGQKVHVSVLRIDYANENANRMQCIPWSNDAATATDIHRLQIWLGLMDAYLQHANFSHHSPVELRWSTPRNWNINWPMQGCRHFIISSTPPLFGVWKMKHSVFVSKWTENWKQSELRACERTEKTSSRDGVVFGLCDPY